LQALYSISAKDGLLFSNSVPFLLVAAQDNLDLSYRFYDYDLMSVMKGLKRYVRQIPTNSGRPIHIHYHTNITVDSDLNLVESEKTTPPPFKTFEEYYEFLQAQVSAVTNNAVDHRRSSRIRPLTTISSGYDSPACAVLAKTAGCTEAITFIKARDDFSDRNDSGKAVADALSLSCVEYDPMTYTCSRDLPEAEFIASGTGGEDVVYCAAEEQLSGTLLYTGYHGDKIWASSGVVPTKDIVRGDPSGSSLTEFRLRVGFFNFPVPFIGCTQHASIHAISTSPAMKAWSVQNDYDRPIPRRIVETAGVPRSLFGASKKAVSLPYQTTGLKNPLLSKWLSETSWRDFSEFLESCPIFTGWSDRQRFKMLHSLYGLSHGIDEWLSKGSGIRKLCSRVFKHYCISDRYLKNRTEHMVAFHWAIKHTMRRYSDAL
jgi:hypothetical protein